MVVQFLCPESGVTKFFEARPDIQQDLTLPFIKLRCKYVFILYTVHFILLNLKYVHNVFIIILPNFQNIFKVSLLFFSSWPLSLC